jgi:hypothetical protein
MADKENNLSRAGGRTDYLALPDAALLAECDVNVHRASGPGGQHRNKVSTAVRLHHRPTGITAQACDSRSQQENRRAALEGLRIKIACQVRRPVEPTAFAPPAVLSECLSVPRKGPPGAPKRLQVGRKDHRFWAVAQCLLDLLEACGGRLAEAAGAIGITTSNLASVLKDDRHLYAAAQGIRRAHGQGPLK